MHRCLKACILRSATFYYFIFVRVFVCSCASFAFMCIFFIILLLCNIQVLTAGQVLKHDSVAVSKINSLSASAAPKPRRILVLTDAPRLLFLDPVGNIVRGNLELSNEGPVEVKMVCKQTAIWTCFALFFSGTVHPNSPIHHAILFFWRMFVPFFVHVIMFFKSFLLNCFTVHDHGF